jgi:hypothetical protein
VRQSEGLATQAAASILGQGPAHRGREWSSRRHEKGVIRAHTFLQEIGTYDEIFKTIENYKGMTIEALQYSKIGKGECGGYYLLDEH